MQDAAAPWTGSRRVDRWLRDQGRGLVPISWDAARLLDERLRVRARVVVICYLPVAAAAVVADFVAVATSHATSSGSPNAGALAWWLASVALITMMPALGGRALTRGERRIGSCLPTRVSSSAPLPPWRRFGIVRITGLLVLVVADTAISIAMPLLRAPTLLVLGYGLALALVLAGVALGGRGLLTAPALAVDTSSLAIDARLRADDIFVIVLPLMWLAGSATLPVGFLSASGSPVGWITLLAPATPSLFVGFIAVSRAASGRPRRSHVVNRTPAPAS